MLKYPYWPGLLMACLAIQSCHPGDQTPFKPASFEEQMASWGEEVIASQNIKKTTIFEYSCNEEQPDAGRLARSVAYDSEGRELEETEYGLAGEEKYKTVTEYYGNGELKETRWYRGNRLTELENFDEKGNRVAYLRYNRSGKLSSTERYDYQRETGHDDYRMVMIQNDRKTEETRFSLNDDGQIIKETVTLFAGDGKAYNSREREFDLNGNPVSYKEFLRGEVTSALLVKYTYDGHLLTDALIYNEKEELVGERHIVYHASGKLASDTDIKHAGSHFSHFVKKVAHYDELGNPTKMSWHNEDDSSYKWTTYEKQEDGSVLVNSYDAGMAPRYQCKLMRYEYF